MQISKQTLLGIMLFGAMPSCPVVADEDEPPLIVSMTRVPETPPPFKAKNLAGQVKEAVQHIVKTDDSSWLRYLQEQHEKEPDVVLNLLKPYLKHSSSKVRRSLVSAAYTRGTRTAFDMMVALCADRENEIRSYAIALLQNEYSHQQIVEWGGARLHDILVWSFMHDLRRESKDAALLIGLFGNREDIPMLRRRLHAVKQDKTALYDDSIALELALSRLGDQEANNHLIQRLESKNAGELMALMGRLRWLPNQELFSRALEFVKDRQMDDGTLPHIKGDIYVVSKGRICDIAFRNFWRVLPIGELKVRRSAPWPDEQLDAAYEIWKKELPNFVAHGSKVQFLKVY